MSRVNQSIKLQAASILYVPLENFEKDFIFIVNGEEIQTTKIIADLLSQKISNFHSLDPTISHFTINTKSRGNFRQFLNLWQFQSINLSNEELTFFSEIIEQLDTKNIDINITKRDFTIDNVLDHLSHDFPYRNFYSQQIKEEIEFISKNFIEIEQKQRSSLLNLSVDVLSSIFSNPNLIIESEDKLLNFINELYSNSNEYSILYEYVYFANVQPSSIENFLNIFDFNDLNSSSWLSITNRLKQKVVQTKYIQNSQRYKNYEVKCDNKDFEIKYDNKDFEGIFNYFRKHSNIKDEVKITASSVLQGDVQKVIHTDSPTSPFNTENNERSWVCFEFVKYKIIPTNYTIRSNNWDTGTEHLKSWVIEGSDDGENWDKIDDVKDSNYLNGSNFTHTFSIQNENKKNFKFIRILQTNHNCNNSYYLCFNSFEIYGFIDKF